jgi:signal transduction histidine kinase
MTVVCLHAEAAQQQWSDDRVVEQSLAVIESAAREAMTHLRTGLGALETEPRPSEQLADEASAFAASLGVPVTVSAGTELSPQERALARRVVREALVNVARHAPGTSAHVRIAHEADRLVVEVTNAASTGSTYVDGSRRGLVGLRDLFSAQGGMLEHGPTPEGGYGVAAYLPSRPSPVPA